MMTLTVGVVGAGGISGAHGTAWSSFDDVDLVVHALDGADRFAERFGARVVDTLDELIAASDLVDVITPTPVHHEIVRAALEAGKDVVCEKPLARTTAQARELVDLATQQGRTIYPAHVVRYFPQYAAAHQAVSSGQLGELAVLRFQRTGSYPLGRGWYSDPVQSGGIAMDQMIHDLDQAAWLAGPVATVYAQRRTGDTPNMVETAHVVLTHENGAITHLRGYWGPPNIEFWYTFNVSGTTGKLTYDSRLEGGFQLTRSADRSNDANLDVSLFDDPYAAEMKDFVASLKAGTAAGVSMHDGVVAVALAEAAEQAATTGEIIDFPAFLEGSN